MINLNNPQDVLTANGEIDWDTWEKMTPATLVQRYPWTQAASDSMLTHGLGCAYYVQHEYWSDGRIETVIVCQPVYATADVPVRVIHLTGVPAHVTALAVAMRAYMDTAEGSPTPINERTSPDAFRAVMPRRVDGLEICTLVAWIPGDDSAYATGVVVTGRPGIPYSTHVLVWAHDNPGHQWLLQAGRHGYADFEDARDDAEIRARQTERATLV